MISRKNPYKRFVLSNGVRLMLVPVTGVESTATSVMTAVGSRYETKQNNGISHFLEHMVFKGTKKYPTTDDVNFIERLGGLQNAYTDIDITSYHNKVLSTDWKSALEINKELALLPLLEEKHIHKERNVIIEEMKRYEDEPAIKVGETFHRMMYPNTQLGMRTIGEVGSLRSLDAHTIRAYHDAWSAPDRIVVVVAGKMNERAMEQYQSAAEDWFGSLPKQKTGDIEIVKDRQEKPNVSIVTKPDAQQAHLILGIRAFSRDSEDRFAWNVFNLLFGVSFTSRLFREIREKRGLCYHIRSSTDNWKDVGYWSIYAGVATDNVGVAVESIMAELTKVVDKGVGEDEVAVAIKRLKTMLAFKSEDPEFLGEYYGRQELYRMPIIPLDGYIKRIEAVTKEDVDTLVRKYIVQKTLNLALVWNRPESAGLEELLKV